MGAPMKATDRRRFNNPHRAVYQAGADAARRGEPVYACAYTHPAMRSSWLRGYSEAQQMPLGFEIEDGGA